MKRQSDEATLVGADQSCSPAGDEEDLLCQARSLDLCDCRPAGNPIRRLRDCDIHAATPASDRCQPEREAADLPGSADSEAGNAQSRSDCAPGKAADSLSLDRPPTSVR